MMNKKKTMKNKKITRLLVLFTLVLGTTPCELFSRGGGGHGGGGRGGGFHGSRGAGGSHSRSGARSGNHSGRSGSHTGRAGHAGHGGHYGNHNWGGYGHCWGGWGWWGGFGWGYFFLGTWVSTIALSSINASNYDSTVSVLNNQIDSLNDKMDDLKQRLNQLQRDLDNQNGSDDDDDARGQIRDLQKSKKELLETVQVVKAELARVKAYKKQDFKDPEKLEGDKPQAPANDSSPADKEHTKRASEKRASQQEVEQEIDAVSGEIDHIEAQLSDEM